MELAFSPLQTCRIKATQWPVNERGHEDSWIFYDAQNRLNYNKLLVEICENNS